METGHPDTTAPAAIDWRFQVVDRLAHFLKWSFMYERNHERVHDAAWRLREALRQVEAGERESVWIRMGEEDFAVAGALVRSRSLLTTWLRDTLLKSALGGVEIRRDATDDALSDFAERVRTCYTRARASEHDERWAEPIDGVRPLEMRFAGHHGEDDPSRPDHPASVNAQLMQDEELVSRLDELEAILTEALGVDSGDRESAAVDLLQSICKSLPTEARKDPNAAIELVRNVLDSCSERIRIAMGGQGAGTRETMDALIAKVGKEIFIRLTGGDLSPADTLPEGRPEDEDIPEDIDSMLAEYDALPLRPGPIALESPVSCGEYASVLLHQLVTVEQQSAVDRCRERLREVLARHPEQRELLRPCIQVSLQTGGDRTPPLPRASRAVELAVEMDLADLLPVADFLTPKVLSRNFPHLFVLFLDRLSAGTGVISTLDAALDLIGAERVADATAWLAGPGGLVEEKRLGLALSTGHPAMAPLVDHLLQDPQAWVPKQIVTFLRIRNLPAAESAALRVVRPFSYLHVEYLRALVNFDPATSPREALRLESGRLIRAYLERTAGREDLHEHRARAATQLALLPSAENLKLLKRLRREAWVAIPTLPRRSFRRAAAASYREMKRRLG